MISTWMIWIWSVIHASQREEYEPAEAPAAMALEDNFPNPATDVMATSLFSWGNDDVIRRHICLRTMRQLKERRRVHVQGAIHAIATAHNKNNIASSPLIIL